MDTPQHCSEEILYEILFSDSNVLMRPKLFLALGRNTMFGNPTLQNIIISMKHGVDSIMLSITLCLLFVSVTNPLFTLYDSHVLH